MILGDKAIRQEIFRANNIMNSSGDRVNPASVNICLGDTFLVPKAHWWKAIRLGDKIEYHRIHVTAEKGFRLLPDEFALATTHEYIRLPHNLAAFVQGRSSIGRAGLSIQNAGYIDPGFHGHITLELKNETQNAIILLPGYPVAQLIFEQTTEVEHPYNGKYNGQIEATGSRMYLDEEAINFSTGH